MCGFVTSHMTHYCTQQDPITVTDCWEKLRYVPTNTFQSEFSLSVYVLQQKSKNRQAQICISRVPNLLTQIKSWWKWKGSSCSFSPWILPASRLRDWHWRKPKRVIYVTQFPWKCTLAVAAAMHTIQSQSSLCEGGGYSGGGLNSLNPEAGVTHSPNVPTTPTNPRRRRHGDEGSAAEQVLINADVSCKLQMISHTVRLLISHPAGTSGIDNCLLLMLLKVQMLKTAYLCSTHWSYLFFFLAKSQLNNRGCWLCAQLSLV